MLNHLVQHFQLMNVEDHSNHHNIHNNKEILGECCLKPISTKLLKIQCIYAIKRESMTPSSNFSIDHTPENFDPLILLVEPIAHELKLLNPEYELDWLYNKKFMGTTLTTTQ